MPNLITPSIGDLFDRLTILSLKVQAGLDRQIDVAHFLAEQQAILARISQAGDRPWPSEVSILREVNTEIWQMTDELRASLSMEGAEKLGARVLSVQAALGRRILRENDKRMRLVEAINQHYGDVRPVEKIEAVRG